MQSLKSCVAFCTLFSLSCAAALQFSYEQTFKIVQFTDLHYGTEWMQDQLTTKVQKRILEKERPDLVIFSGDMVSGDLFHKAGPLWYQRRCVSLQLQQGETLRNKSLRATCDFELGQTHHQGALALSSRWEYLVEAVLEAEVPWASILGNHDREADLEGPDIVHLDQKTSNLSLTKLVQPSPLGSIGSPAHKPAILTGGWLCTYE